MADECHCAVKAAVALPFFASEVEAFHGSNVRELGNTEAADLNVVSTFLFLHYCVITLS